MSDERDLFDSLDQMDGVPWDDIGRLNQDGYVDTQPVGDDPRIFEDQFELRSREKERSPANVQAVTPIPQRAGPWTANNQLGIEQGFAPDANNNQTILKLDEWGFPEVWTVTLGLDYGPTEQLGSFINFEVTAQLRFGVGGVTQEVEVDWKNGTTICLPFNALNVVAKYNAFQVRGAGAVPTNLRLRASVAKGNLPGSCPTRSYAFPAASDLDVDLPKFAKSLFVVPPDIGSLSPFDFYTQDWEVVFHTNNANPSSSTARYRISQCVTWIDFTNELVGGPMWLPVPPYARTVTIQTPAGVLITDQATLIFKLGF